MSIWEGRPPLRLLKTVAHKHIWALLIIKDFNSLFILTYIFAEPI